MDAAGELSKEYLTACRERDIPKIMEMYPTISEMVLPVRGDHPLLTREDTRRTLQALHYHIRTNRNPAARMQQLEPFIERIVTDIKKGQLSPHPAAFVHLLGIYKQGERYEKGNRFWQWLAEQDDAYMDQSVYGAAIELLAEEGKESLEALEELYRDALKRYPGTFAEYHLSPEAVLADRTAPTNIPGLPITLLQGITTARLLAGDWKNAYLALDTALRLYPTTLPERFIQLFMKDRPVNEAYTVFLIACRAGRSLPAQRLTNLAGRLRDGMKKTISQAERMQYLRAIANATYAFAETGAQVNGQHVAILLDAIRFVLPYRGSESHFSEEELEMRNQLAMTAHALASLMVQSSIPMPQPLFTALVHIAGRYQVRELLDAVLTDIEAGKIALSDVDRRVVLQACGEMRDAALVEKHWNNLVQVTEKAGDSPTQRDWETFARAARRASATDLVNAQLKALAHAVSPALTASVNNILQNNPPTENDYTFHLMSASDFSASLAAIDASMRNVAAVLMAGAPLDMAANPFSMFLDPRRKLMAPVEVVRAVYDRMTVDPHQPPLARAVAVFDPQVSRSSTGVSLEELRFLNWVAVNELMVDAERAERGEEVETAPKEEVKQVEEKSAASAAAGPAGSEAVEKSAEPAGSEALQKPTEPETTADAEHTSDPETSAEADLNDEQVDELLTRMRQLRGLPEHSIPGAARGVPPRPRLRYYINAPSGPPSSSA